MYGFENHAMGWGWTGMILMWIVPLLLFVVVLRYFTGRTDGQPKKTAREILDARYAGGEMEREDYLARLADLKN